MIGRNPKHPSNQNTNLQKVKESQKNGLYIVSTPIGNAQDITLRALSILKEAHTVVCEDTRVAKKLFKIHGISNKLLAYHEHNAPKTRPLIMKRLLSNQFLALICDAGSPLISDPGYKLVVSCIENHIPVTVVPGPSSVLTALTISGLPVDKFYFQGFLPRKPNIKKAALKSLKTIPGSLIFFENSNRLGGSLSEMADILGNRKIVIARELTKFFEEVIRGSLEDLSSYYKKNTPPKGELTIVVGPEKQTLTLTKKQLVAKISEALEKNSTKDAVTLVAQETGFSKRGIYATAIKLKKC